MSIEKLRVGTQLREKSTGNLFWIELVESGGIDGYAYTLDPETAEKVNSVNIGAEAHMPFEVYIETK